MRRRNGGAGGSLGGGGEGGVGGEQACVNCWDCREEGYGLLTELRERGSGGGGGGSGDRGGDGGGGLCGRGGSCWRQERRREPVPDEGWVEGKEELDCRASEEGSEERIHRAVDVVEGKNVEDVVF